MATNNSNEIENSVDTTPYNVVATNNDSNRWGISALSKSNKDIAYAEEIMMNKITGELLIKTPENDIISYEYNSRLKNHLDVVTLMAYNMGICGKIYSIDNIVDKDLPDVVDFRLLYENTVEFDNSYSRCMFSIDLDCLTVREQELTNQHNIPNIEYRLSFMSNGDIMDMINGLSPLNEFNNKVFQLKDSMIFDSISISITFEKNESFNDNGIYRAILNSMLVVVE